MGLCPVVQSKTTKEQEHRGPGQWDRFCDQPAQPSLCHHLSFPSGPDENGLCREAHWLLFLGPMNVPISRDTDSYIVSKICGKGIKKVTSSVSQRVKETMIVRSDEWWRWVGQWHAGVWGTKRNKGMAWRTSLGLRNMPPGRPLNAVL